MKASAVAGRPYQHRAVAGVLGRFDKGDAATLLVLPTGTGKTIVAGMVARACRDRLGRTLFLAHREELITQGVDKLSRLGLECAVEMAGQDAKAHAALFGSPDVVVATVQTLQGKRLARWDPAHFGLVITDEAHHARAETYRHVYDHFAAARHLGMTATPDRGDGKNLGAVYDSVAYEYSLRDAIREGHLVPLLATRCLTGVSLDAIRTTGGDYNAGDLEARIAPHIEELADATVREIGRRPAIVFTPDVGSAEAFASALGQKGVPATAVSGRLPRAERAKRLADYRNRLVQAVCCCDLLIEGWDCPHVAAVVVCRPTRKRNRYAQMVGRGTRPDPGSGKADCLIVDFAWETTAGHELVRPIDLFDDTKADPADLAAAQQLLDAGRTRDPQEALDRARTARLERERQLRLQREMAVRCTGRRATYRKFVYDPVGVGEVLGLPALRDGWDLDPEHPASDKQRALLQKLGVEDPSGYSRLGASRALDELLARVHQHKATVRQVGALIRNGVDPEQARTLHFDEAGAMLDQLIGGRRARTAS